MLISYTWMVQLLVSLVHKADLQIIVSHFLFNSKVCNFLVNTLMYIIMVDHPQKSNLCFSFS